ncbi:MAG: DUF4154 domain-containing protein [Myxococcaceae bacterium]|nr:DUF4154 domain-containing protein [Myxococcaceae bacterium]
MRWLAASASLLIATAAAGQGASAEVPVSQAMLVMLKVLTYDEGFERRGQGDFVVSVPASKGREAEAAALVASLQGLEVKRIKKRALVYRVTGAGGDDAGGGDTADAVLLSSALSPEDVKAALEAAKRQGRYSLALTAADVSAGALVGVVATNGKPQPMVNVTTARAVGATFSVAVLRVARTVQ